MLKTVRDACAPHRMALDFSLAEQIEDLGDVISRAGDGAAFFAKNHLTAGMRQLFDLGLRRLAGARTRRFLNSPRRWAVARRTR